MTLEQAVYRLTGKTALMHDITDRGFIAAGGSRMPYTVIPFASHSLRSLIIAGPMIERALDNLVAGG